MSLEDVKLGKTYNVRIEDCCVWGSFTSKLIDIDEEENCTFENGVKIGGWGAIAEEVEK